MFAHNGSPIDSQVSAKQDIFSTGVAAGNNTFNGYKVDISGGEGNLLAPHTSGPRDVPRCGALSLLQKTPHYRGGSSRNRC